ncbi:MAG: hypothetical protein A2X48_02195 [Lentisphaerae bacterium GWF2_49_21]|nr:MAG: hypothetical protein A2X48_02195 [Lentisphaerae bacterium GWF2_49_21]
MALIKKMIGAVVKEIRVNIVDPEFNVVYLQTDKGVFAIQGEIGGEYLGIYLLEVLPEITNQNGYMIVSYPVYDCFIGRRICEVHQIGEAWKGHGIEICFETIPERTLIVQSIYSGDKPKDCEDCLRLGMGVYEFIYRTKHTETDRSNR